MEQHCPSSLCTLGFTRDSYERKEGGGREAERVNMNAAETENCRDSRVFQPTRRTMAQEMQTPKNRVIVALAILTCFMGGYGCIYHVTQPRKIGPDSLWHLWYDMKLTLKASTIKPSNAWVVSAKGGRKWPLRVSTIMRSRSSVGG